MQTNVKRVVDVLRILLHVLPPDQPLWRQLAEVRGGLLRRELCTDARYLKDSTSVIDAVW